MNSRRFRVAAVVAILCVFAQTTDASAASPPRAGRAAGPEAASRLAKAALAEFQAGRYAQSAELYEKAWRADPGQPGYLFGVGRAEQKAGHWQAAIAAFETLLGLLAPSDPLALRARKALNVARNAAAEAAARQPAVASPAPVALPAVATPAVAPVEIAVSATPVALPAVPTPAAAPAPPAVAQVSSAALPSTPAAIWAAAGLGAACLVGAGAAALSAWQADRDADRYRIAGSQLFDPEKLSESAATTRIDAINADRGLAIGLGLVGLAATAAGAWLWRNHSAANQKTKASR